MIWRRPRKLEWFGAGIALLAGLCYVQTISYGFVSDDHHLIFNHPYTQRVADWLRIFTSGHYDGRGGYRPITTLSFALNYLVGGANPIGYHLVNIGLHAINSVLVLLLLNRVLRSHLAAVIGAMIFAVHPIHTEVVAWISGRAELLATAFFLLAWLYHLHGRNVTALFARPRILSSLAFFAALLSKENALIFPVAIVLSDSLISRWQSHWDALTNLSWLEKCKRLYLPSLVVVGFYFLFRWSLYSRPLLRLPWKIHFVDNPLVQASAVTRMLTALKVQGEYLWLLVWPRNLCADYSFNAVPLVTKFGDPSVLWSSAVLIALLVFAGYSFSRRGRAWFGILFYLLAIAPVANLLTVIGTIKAERLLYLPSLGFCICAGLFGQRTCAILRERISSGPLCRVVSVGALVCVLGAGMLLTWQRNKIWRSETTLWQDTVQKAPHNIKAQLYFGNAALTNGRMNEAIDAFENALRINPQSEDALINLGAALMQQGRNDEAILHLEEAVRQKPRRATFHLNLGLAYLAAGRPASGVRELQRAIELKPNHAVAHFDLGLALSKTGDVEGAVREYHRAIALKSDYAEAWNGLGASHWKLGQLEEARRAFHRAVELKPGYPEALYNTRLLDQAR